MADEADSTGLIDNTSGPDAPDLELAVAPVSLRPLPNQQSGITIVSSITVGESNPVPEHRF
jgi:choline dehydrogenase